ncbi:hypothetical protein STEG23_027613 [Scotinomys teguina]
MPTRREYPQVRIIHYMDDILLAAPSQVMLDKAYAHTVQALEKKGLYIAPEKVQKDSIDNHYPKDNLLLFITHHPVIFPKVTAMEPLKGAIEIYTDGSKSGVGAYMLQGQDPVQFRFQPNTPQIVECQIVYEVFKRFHEPFNLLSDSHYVVNAVRGLETSAFIKESSPVHDILWDICVRIWDRTAPFFIGYIRAHTLLPGPMTAANDLADKATKAYAAVELDSISMAKQFHQLYHVPAHTLCLKFKISWQSARDIVKACPSCVQFLHPPHVGINPRGLHPDLWQMDVTHIPSFGKLSYVHVSVDTCSGVIFASLSGEKVTNAISHCLEAWAAWGKPLAIKTDNGPAYTSKSFHLFCLRMQVRHITGLPYNPQGQACQGRTWEWRQISKGFSLSPSIKRYLLDSKRSDSSSGDGWPWFQWLISNEAGAVSDISALAQLGGIEHHLVNISGNLTDHKGDRRLSHIKENGELFNATLPEAAVCVQPPYVFLLTNAPPTNNVVDCFKNSCLLAECWNGTWTLTVIVKVPTFVPIPVEADPKTFPIMTLLRERRDFGITAAIVAAIALSAASAVTASVAMTNQIQSAQTINTVVEQTSAVMETQHRINKHLMSGIVAANQRMDLIQTQVEEFFGLIQIGCIAKLKHMCVTPLRFDEAGNESRKIKGYLAGNWTRDTELLMRQQLLQIAALNETRVEPISLGDFTDWLSSAFSFFKEWVGVGIFGAICCFGIVLSLWFLCRLRARQARDKAVIIQALAALDHGVSPQVWLASLKEDL